MGCDGGNGDGAGGSNPGSLVGLQHGGYGAVSSLLSVGRAGGQLGQEGRVLLAQAKPVFSKKLQNCVASRY